MLLEQCKDCPHALGLFLIHHQPSSARVYVIAQHRTPDNLVPLKRGDRHVLARTLEDQLPLELRKGEQNVERQTSQRCAGIELLSDGNEAPLVLLEDAEHAGEVQQRTAQAVHFIHHHAIQFACFYGMQEPLHCRPVQVGAGEAPTTAKNPPPGKAGAMKKAGYAIESFKPEGGEPDQPVAWAAPNSPARLRPWRAFLLVGSQRCLQETPGPVPRTVYFASPSSASE